MTAVVSFVNQKGGVGKTTTTYHIARAGVRARLKILVVDMDPQGNLTSRAAREDLPSNVASIADVLSHRTRSSISDVVVDGVWDDLDVVPSGNNVLMTVRDELVVAGAGRESRFAQALNQTSGYDLILVDCPPSLDQLTINALTASSTVVIVAEPEAFSSQGLVQVTESIAEVQEYYNKNLQITGVLVNGRDRRRITDKEELDLLRTHCEAAGLLLMEPVMEHRAQIGDSIRASVGLDQWPDRDGAVLAAQYSHHLNTILKGILR
jgi:chromosome partitioning protein